MIPQQPALPPLTFGRMRRALQTRRRVVQTMAAVIADTITARGFTPHALDDVSLTVSREEFDDLEWAMGHVKMRDPETGQLVRVNGRFCRSSIPRPHVLVKNCPVFEASA